MPWAGLFTIKVGDPELTKVLGDAVELLREIHVEHAVTRAERAAEVREFLHGLNNARQGIVALDHNLGLIDRKLDTLLERTK